MGGGDSFFRMRVSWWKLVTAVTGAFTVNLKLKVGIAFPMCNWVITIRILNQIQLPTMPFIIRGQDAFGDFSGRAASLGRFSGSLTQNGVSTPPQCTRKNYTICTVFVNIFARMWTGVTLKHRQKMNAPQFNQDAFISRKEENLSDAYVCEAVSLG